MLSDSELEDEANPKVFSSSILNSDNHNIKTNSFKSDEYTMSKNLTGLTKYSNGKFDNHKNSFSNSNSNHFDCSLSTSNIAPDYENGISFDNISPPRDAMNEYLHENLRNLDNGSYLIPSPGHSLDTNSSGLNSYCNGFSMHPLHDDHFLMSSDEENQVLVWQDENRKKSSPIFDDLLHSPDHNERNENPPGNPNNLLCNQVSEDFIDIDMLPQSYMTQSDMETEEELLERLPSVHPTDNEFHNDLSGVNKKPIMNDFWNNLNRRLSNDSAGSSLQFEARGECSSPRNSAFNRRDTRQPFFEEHSNQLTSYSESHSAVAICSLPGRSLRHEEEGEDADSESSDTVPVYRSSNKYGHRQLQTLHRSSAILSDISNDPLNSVQSKRILNSRSPQHSYNVQRMKTLHRKSEGIRVDDHVTCDESYSASPALRNRYHLSGLNRLTPCASTGHLLDLDVNCNQPSALLKANNPSKSLDLDSKCACDKSVRPANSVDRLAEKNFPEPNRCQLPRQSGCNGSVVKPLYISSCLMESDRFRWSHGFSTEAASDDSSAMIWSDLQATLSQRAQRLPCTHASVAVINMLRALRLSHHAGIPNLICSLTARQNVTRSDSSGRVQGYSDLPQYLISRGQQGISGHRLVSMVNQALPDLVVGRFFQTGSDLNISVSNFLMHWIRLGAVPILTINTQMGVPEMYVVPDTAWQHQMVYGVTPQGICLSNPNETVPESLIQHQLNSSSTLLIRQCDILANWSPNCDITELCRQNDPRWNLMNVLGQVVCTIRESQHENFPGFKPSWAHHIRIPCIHKPGISLFVAATNRKAVNQLLSARELCNVHSESISFNYESDHSSSQFSASLLPPQSSPSESTDSSSNSASSAVSSLHLSASRAQSTLQPLLNVPGSSHTVHQELMEPSTPSSDFLVHNLETQSSLATAPSTSLSTGDASTDSPFNFLTRSVSHAVSSMPMSMLSSRDTDSTVSYSCPTTTSVMGPYASIGRSSVSSTASSAAGNRTTVTLNHAESGQQSLRNDLVRSSQNSDSENYREAESNLSRNILFNVSANSSETPQNDVISLSQASRSTASDANLISVNSLAVSRTDTANRSHGSSTVALPR